MSNGNTPSEGFKPKESRESNEVKITVLINHLREFPKLYMDQPGIVTSLMPSLIRVVKNARDLPSAFENIRTELKNLISDSGKTVLAHIEKHIFTQYPTYLTISQFDSSPSSVSKISTTGGDRERKPDPAILHVVGDARHRFRTASKGLRNALIINGDNAETEKQNKK